VLFHLAEGTFARVYRAEHVSSGQPLAVKVRAPVGSWPHATSESPWFPPCSPPAAASGSAWAIAVTLPPHSQPERPTAPDEIDIFPSRHPFWRAGCGTSAWLPRGVAKAGREWPAPHPQAVLTRGTGGKSVKVRATGLPGQDAPLLQKSTPPPTAPHGRARVRGRGSRPPPSIGR